MLTEPYEPEFANTSLYIPPEVAAGNKVLETRVRILEIGPACWTGEKPRAKVGDVVLVTKFGGAMVKSPVDGNLYKMVNDNDIFCLLDVDAAKEKAA